MLCYACGNELNEQDYCTACGADVRDYKQIRYLSNRLYNEGLDKARVRDLSGAAGCLRQSLKLYKGNIEARNLLGLIYYETGEVVSALTEWVISTNLREDRNPASYFLNRVQSEPQRLDTLGRTAKKYNLALNYAWQEDYDLAIIQLKRILQLNPGFLRARELLALLYLHAGEYERAKLECNRCLRIDSGDTMAKRYLKEAQAALIPVEQKRGSRRKDDVIRYQSGNEIIIQPTRSVVRGGVITFATALFGIAIGIAIAWTLILPNRISRVQQASRQEITSVSEESDAKSIKIRNLEQELSSLDEQIKTMEAQAQETAGTGELRSAGLLIQAVAAWLKDPEDLDRVREYLRDMDPDAPEMTEIGGVQALYQNFIALVGVQMADAFYHEGYEAYRNEDDVTAIARLSKASAFDEDHVDALYFLGRAYYRSGNTEKARAVFEKVTERFPDSDQATEAQNLLAEMNHAGT
ncbi:MAG: tetratricopeptide repeat protein [Lachnospiraceae bacterium]|nr:tetratricopeptide repeat protein [Lachnospiraceae bacterium]